MLLDGYQNSYGNIYSAVTDIISSQYATGFATLLPSRTSRSQLYAQGALPEFALFDTDCAGILVCFPLLPPRHYRPHSHRCSRRVLALAISLSTAID